MFSKVLFAKCWPLCSGLSVIDENYYWWIFNYLWYHCHHDLVIPKSVQFGYLCISRDICFKFQCFDMCNLQIKIENIVTAKQTEFWQDLLMVFAWLSGPFFMWIYEAALDVMMFHRTRFKGHGTDDNNCHHWWKRFNPKVLVLYMYKTHVIMSVSSGFLGHQYAQCWLKNQMDFFKVPFSYQRFQIHFCWPGNEFFLNVVIL